MQYPDMRRGALILVADVKTKQKYDENLACDFMGINSKTSLVNSSRLTLD